MERTAIDVVSIASARLKLGIGRTRIQSRTCPRTARSHPFPSAPARIRAPSTGSPRNDGARRRKIHAINGAAAIEVAIQTGDGKSPHAMPLFTVSWIDSSPGTTGTISPSSTREKASDLVARSRAAPARATPKNRGHGRLTSLQRPDRAPRRVQAVRKVQHSPAPAEPPERAFPASSSRRRTSSRS